MNDHMEYQENWIMGIQDTRGHVWPIVLVNFAKVKG